MQKPSENIGRISPNGDVQNCPGQPKQKPPHRAPVRCLFAATFLATCLACGNAPTIAAASATNVSAAAASFSAVTPKRGEIVRSIVLPGEIRPLQQATLFSKVAGYLKTIAVDKGDAVTQGALIADIEVPELLADRVRFKAELEVATIEYQRLADSIRKAPDLVVPQTLDTAKGKLEVAKANLERVDTLLGFSKITAPFSGIVTRRLVDPGAFIPVATSGASQAGAIVTVMDFNTVRVQVAVPESESPLVVKGQPVQIQVEGLPGRVFQGQVTRFAYALDEATKTMLAEAELPNPKLELRPGMYASVKIGIERKTGALLLPSDAVFMEKAGASVFTSANGKAKKVPVKIGFQDGTNIEIVSGITPETSVLLVGKRPVQDGQSVTVVEAK